MAEIVLQTQVTLPAGIRTYGPRTIPDAIRMITLEIAHGGGVQPGLAWGLMLSMDGGVTWRPFGAAGTHGQQSGLSSGLTVSLPAGSGRQVQAFIWTSQSMTLEISVTVT